MSWLFSHHCFPPPALFVLVFSCLIPFTACIGDAFSSSLHSFLLKTRPQSGWEVPTCLLLLIRCGSGCGWLQAWFSVLLLGQAALVFHSKTCSPWFMEVHIDGTHLEGDGTMQESSALQTPPRPSSCSAGGRVSEQGGGRAAGGKSRWEERRGSRFPPMG